MSKKERVVLICPGRGTYNQAEWGYLKRYHNDKTELLEAFDTFREGAGQPRLQALDSELPFQLKLHSRGDHASALIYACAYADALSIDLDRYEVVAVTGNSLGWYITLAAAGSLPPMIALELINTMGQLMQDALIGGQLIYPCSDEQWVPQPELRASLLALAAEHGAELSIDLGGMLVFGGSADALQRLSNKLPPRDPFPMKLHNHAAFHTSLQQPVLEQARSTLAHLAFNPPSIPMIDGRGNIWTSWSSDPQLLWDYTLGHQLVKPYDFARAIQVAVKEFAPDKLVLLGPGGTLGGSIAQSLIQTGAYGLQCKADFIARQQSDPLLLSMGIEEQRQRLLPLE